MILQRTFPQHIVDAIFGVSANVLNGLPPRPSQFDDEQLDILLKKCSARIKAEAVDPASGNVNYAYLRSSHIYREYRELTAQLPTFDLRLLETDEQKLAFWLNLYNTLVMDGIVQGDVHISINTAGGFFRRTAYNIGGYRICLDDIEHGILRANAGHPFIPGPQFGPHDPRRHFTVARIDNRIHFALVCGALSCPPISFYAADKIHVQLDLATRNFLDQTVEIDMQNCVIRLSKLLQWYSEDFGMNSRVKFGFGDKTPLLLAVKPYITDEAKRTLLDSAAIDSARIRFKRYDWTLNSV